jgi:uncharacterized cupin superfamily protein
MISGSSQRLCPDIARAWPHGRNPNARGPELRLQTFNLFNGETDEVPAGAPGDQGRAARVGSKLGAEKLGMSVYDLPPGAEIGPYHLEWTHEEMLIAVSGQVVIRDLSGEQTLDPGDVVSFPTGADGAHQVRNTSGTTARVAIVSSQHDVCIVEYPEDKKVKIWAGNIHYTLDTPGGTEH